MICNMGMYFANPMELFSLEDEEDERMTGDVHRGHYTGT